MTEKIRGFIAVSLNKAATQQVFRTPPPEHRRLGVLFLFQNILFCHSQLDWESSPYQPR
ncbi:MAG: hypothetical protein US57_C0011G0106 [Candidatus Moranbacteria bacterium GW2011_GWC2_37_73]|nr:MAG: hypothetical protein UR95_C0006G0074 [Parcubacteria group bacterium GW2011_GWC1_36_108]KKQ00465.1 MAG: hypothetical protein US09_C0011G0023 [Candidatus Moranbacteria bacterium GW2011_GWD1_36_198]KKQ01697.1 MAG: hypothetical protein US10_C0009G0016 [Candidatus Moranbacteria bacterium GW2011_GWD2_36_198]KKQ39618.1 MAG: hypothetical protein US57_C0011G0106 [Candidatus Moranbacteria bacterium GW2011_GWC2_37_73]